MIFLYKIFYVYFLAQSKNKSNAPWHGALCMIIICAFSLLFSIMIITRLLDPFLDFIFSFNDHSKIALLIFSILLIYLLYKIFSYLFFEKMMVSKENGIHPFYKFEPTKAGKFKIQLIGLIIIFSPFILKGLEMYLQGKIFK